MHVYVHIPAKHAAEPRGGQPAQEAGQNIGKKKKNRKERIKQNK
jgi:hypothetical protein